MQNQGIVEVRERARAPDQKRTSRIAEGYLSQKTRPSNSTGNTLRQKTDPHLSVGPSLESDPLHEHHRFSSNFVMR